MERFSIIFTCLLVTCCVIIPTQGTTASTGTILYVSGNGPGNYTTIQSAINAAVDGDTIYVYDDSSPYHENITIDKTLNVVGENPATTIIDSNYSDCAVNMSANGSSIQGFTIQKAVNGVIIRASDITITQTIIRTVNLTCIYADDSNERGFEGIVIDNNTLHAENSTGIQIALANNSRITKNTIVGFISIILIEAFHTNVSYNHILNSDDGIFIIFSNTNTIFKNTFTNSRFGIELACANANAILDNNFINNPHPADFACFPRYSFVAMRAWHDNPMSKNFHMSGKIVFDGNYWNHARRFPYIIPGQIGMGISVRLFHYNWFIVDRHPAQQPYDIPT